MSATPDILGNPNSDDRSAAISRFFYDPEQYGGKVAGLNLHSHNVAFQERYQAYLKHPLSIIASFETPSAETEVPPAYVTISFDMTWADDGILGWQLNVAQPAYDVTSLRRDIAHDGSLGEPSVFSRAPVSTHGRRVFLAYTAAKRATAAMRRMNAQGSAYSTLLIPSGDRLISPSAVHAVIAALLQGAEIDETVQGFDTRQTELAKRAMQLLVQQQATPTNQIKQKLNQARKDYEAIGFRPTNHSFPVQKPWQDDGNGAVIATIQS